MAEGFVLDGYLLPSGMLRLHLGKDGILVSDFPERVEESGLTYQLVSTGVKEPDSATPTVYGYYTREQPNKGK